MRLDIDDGLYLQREEKNNALRRGNRLPLTGNKQLWGSDRLAT